MNQDNYEILKDWKTMDTRLAERYSDETLLEQTALANVLGGWGQIAELMKRYARLKGLL
mgnify:CR=1 FL=1